MFCIATPTYSFPDLANSNVLCITEGSSHYLQFKVTSDLPLEESLGRRHTLSRLDDICSRRVYTQGDTIVFERVNRRDAGTYFIGSCNVVGKGETEFQLRVKCKSCMLCLIGLGKSYHKTHYS